MIREYERTLNSSDKQILEKLINRDKSKSFKTKMVLSILTFAVIFSWFLLWATGFNYLPVTIIITIVSIFIGYQSYSEILDLKRISKRIIESKDVVINGMARVTEIKIDRYLEIKIIEERLNYFLIEFEGNLKLIKPSYILGSNRLNTLTEKIDLLDINKEHVIHSSMNYPGNKLEPHLVVTKQNSKEMFESNLWESLINNETLIGNLEGFE